MSNSIYNILNNFNKVAQEPTKPATQIDKPKTKLQESVEGVLNEKYMGFKKVAAAAKAGGAENPEAVAASIGRKKYGKEKFQKAAAAGKKLGEGNNPFANVDSRVEKPTIPGTTNKAKSGYYPPAKPPVAKLAKPIDETGDETTKSSDSISNAVNSGKRPVDAKGKPVKENGLQRYTGIKKYGKDGFEALQKAGREGADEEEKGRIKDRYTKKSKNKVEETIQSLLAAGFTKDQIVEGWDDMMKSVEKSRRDDKGTGKFDNKKISTGTVYTRKYNPKTGEADDSENVTKEKRGRGRPKKSAFEGKYSSANKMLSEQYSFIEGRIEGGVWVDKPGNVPVPQNPEVAPPTPKTGITGKAAQDLMKSSDPNMYNKLTKTPTPAKTTKAVVDPEGVKEDDMEEGNEFSGNRDDAIKAGDNEFSVGGKTYPVKEEQELEEALNQMRRIAGLPVIEAKADKKADKDYDNDGKIESGKDEYLGSKIRAAKDAGKLKEGKMCKTCDCSPCECDKEKVDECSSPMGNGMMGQEAAGKMNISTNMSSDGNKSVTITADGDAALDLMQMLKLAGMQGAESKQQEEPAGVMVVSTGDQEEVEEAKDERYHASTTPDEQVSPVQAQTKGGNGDVAGQEKQMRKGGYQFGDNNLAMKDVNEGITGLEAMGRKLYKEYQSIKVQK